MQADGFYPSKKIRQRGNRYWVELNLWPFVGVLMVLLTVFMFAFTPSNICDRRIRADIPVMRHSVPLPNSVKEDAIYIHILRDQALYLGNSRPVVEELGPEIQKRIINGSEKRIYLEVDSRVRYGFVKQVLEQIQDAKIQNVTFIAKSDPI